MFWHHCDFVAGLTIDENILRAIKLGQTVIFVCSEHFHKSEFCQKELKYALHSHYKEYNGNYRRVIPLVIRDGECTKELKQLQPIRVTTRTNETKDYGHKTVKKLCLGNSFVDITLSTHNLVGIHIPLCGRDGMGHIAGGGGDKWLPLMCMRQKFHHQRQCLRPGHNRKFSICVSKPVREDVYWKLFHINNINTLVIIAECF